MHVNEESLGSAITNTLPSLTISPEVRAAERRDVVESLKDPDARKAFYRAHMQFGIPSQIRGMRQAREWSQSELGKILAKPQSQVSRLEDQNYGRYNLNTLCELADAFDVALLVAFVPFSFLASRVSGYSLVDVEVPSFEKDAALLRDEDVASTGVAQLFRVFPAKMTGAAIDPVNQASTATEHEYFQTGLTNSG